MSNEKRDVLRDHGIVVGLVAEDKLDLVAVLALDHLQVRRIVSDDTLGDDDAVADDVHDVALVETALHVADPHGE